MQLDRRAYLVQRLSMIAEEHRDRVPALFEPDAPGRFDVELYILRGRAALSAVLQRGHAGSMLRSIDVDAIRVERLAKHQKGLAMRIGIALR